MPDKRDQLIDIATRSIQRDGLKSVSFRQLADKVGVKSSSVHYHFPTKPDLAAAIVDEYTVQFSASLEAISRKHHTLDGALNALIDIFEDVLERRDLCLCAMMASELTSLDSTTHLSLRRFFKVVEDWLQAQFEKHQDQLRLALAHRQLAEIILAGLEGALLLDRVEAISKRLDAFRSLARSLTH